MGSCSVKRANYFDYLTMHWCLCHMFCNDIDRISSDIVSIVPARVFLYRHRDYYTSILWCQQSTLGQIFHGLINTIGHLGVRLTKILRESIVPSICLVVLYI